MWPFRRRSSEPPADPVLPPVKSPHWIALWDTYVPAKGQADTVQGELLRVVERVTWEFQNTGCMNWGPTFDLFCAFARNTLGDGTFPPRTTAFVRKTFDDMVTLGRWYAARDALYAKDEEDPVATQMDEDGPEAEPEPEHLQQMQCLTELWCDAHPAPILRAHDPRLEF